MDKIDKIKEKMFKKYEYSFFTREEFEEGNKSFFELIEILEKYEIFTITEALKELKSPYELLCIINNILYDIINLTRYEIETKEQKKDFEELKKIKDKILIIKNKNFK